MKPTNGSPAKPWHARPAGRPIALGLAAIILVVPAGLFWDSLVNYRLHSDDFAYVAASRNFPRACSNLFVPHNTHIVPAWRLLTWCMSAAAGSLANLQPVLAIASYSILVVVMILMGRIARRETQSTATGLLAMVAVGVTSLEKTSATWYSAGQTLWAGLGVLMMLLSLQGWRKSGGAWRLVAAAFWAWFAGAMWTIGHIAGPAGAVYLWFDGRPQSRRAAVVPLAATVVSILLALGLGAKKMDATVSFHGRTAKEAFSVVTGTSYTLQAIPENLILGNLGLTSETHAVQGLVLCLALLAGWAWTMRTSRSPSPLEAAGAVIVAGAYVVEWSFRAYMPFRYLRGIVPWYDTIPHLGAVLFVVGLWGRIRHLKEREPLSWGELLGIVGVVCALIAVHQPRITAWIIRDMPEMRPEEKELYLIEPLQRFRGVILASEFAHWQKLHLARLDRAEPVAKRLGIGRGLIRQAFGRVLAPEIPKEYDAADMLDLPEKGREHDPAVARSALARYFTMEPEPFLPLPARPAPKVAGGAKPVGPP